jgi:hypothetical protein
MHVAYEMEQKRKVWSATNTQLKSNCEVSRGVDYKEEGFSE